MDGSRARHARTLFDGVAGRYDAPAEALSFGQYARWRRALVRALPAGPQDVVLDVATGTGLIARGIERRARCRVVGVDQSGGMLRAARARGNGAMLAGSDANVLPFPDATFDHVVFSYLLRYVARPEETLRELARVLKPGGTLACVEFGLPDARWARLGWDLYARGVFPLASRLWGRGWREVGAFLGGSIREWAEGWPLERQARAWLEAGIEDVRARRMTLGAGVVTTGRKRGG